MTDLQTLLKSIGRAKARLTAMKVQEVSLVDAAANLRKFVITKRDQQMSDESIAKLTFKLPSAAKQGIMDGLAVALDKLTALSSAVSEAEVDDASAVPVELGAALAQTGEMLDGLAAQYAPAAEAAAETAEAVAEGEPPPVPPPAPPEGAVAMSASVGKQLPPVQTDPGYKVLMHEGDSMETALRKATAIAHLEVAKAGKKISGARYKKLAELHDGLGKLLNELAYDEAAAATPAAKSDAFEPVAKATVPPPNGKTAEATPPTKQFTWPIDISASVRKRRETGAKR